MENKETSCLSILEKTEILQSLVDCIEPVDFEALKYPALSYEQLKGEKRANVNDKKVIIVDEILKAAKANDWGLCSSGTNYFVYNGNYWEKLNPDEIKRFLSDCAERFGIIHTQAKEERFADSLLKQFQFAANLTQPDCDREKVLINLKNGTFEISTDRQFLRDFNREDFLTYQLSFKYDEKAQAQTFAEYLNRVLPDKTAQDLLAEYVGYLFIRNGSGMKLEKCLILYGKGANGKSVFFEVLTAMLGKENVSTFSLYDLTNENGYYRAQIANKIVNYSTEINGKMNVDIFKKIASGEPITVRNVYEKPVDLFDYAKIMFNTNELPKDTEQTNAFFRRLMIIPFNVTIPDSEQDKELHHKIIEKELAGVFNWVIDGLKRLLRNGKFTECKAANECLDQYKTDSDTVATFLSENSYQKSTTEAKPLKELYDEYRTFCMENGYRAASNRTFSERMRNRGFECVKTGKGKFFYVETAMPENEETEETEDEELPF